MQSGPLRFSTIAAAVPDLSDRMLSDRLKELESYRLVERTVYPGPPVRVQYALTHARPAARTRARGAQALGAAVAGLATAGRAGRARQCPAVRP